MSKLRHIVVTAVVSLVLCGCGSISTTQTGLPSRCESSARRLAQKLAVSLPKGWSVRRELNAIVVTRDAKIRSANFVNSPPLASAEERGKAFQEDTFRIRLVLSPRLTDREYKDRKRANEEIAEKMQRQQDLMHRNSGIVRKSNEYVGFTQEGRALVITYKQLAASLNTLPEYYFDDCSVRYEDFPWILTIEPEAVGRECRTVSDYTIKPLMQRY